MGITIWTVLIYEFIQATFLKVVASAIVDKYIGESARIIREMFGFARDHEPCVIFMDEIVSKQFDSSTPFVPWRNTCFGSSCDSSLLLFLSKSTGDELRTVRRLLGIPVKRQQMQRRAFERFDKDSSFKTQRTQEDGVQTERDQQLPLQRDC